MTTVADLTDPDIRRLKKKPNSKASKQFEPFDYVVRKPIITCSALPSDALALFWLFFPDER